MNKFFLFSLLGGTLLLAISPHGWTEVKRYELTITSQPVNLTGRSLEKITVNGSIPGPVLEFIEGDEAEIAVTNHMDVPTSVHWHGLLLPNIMDGVPGMGGFTGIAPGETFTYRFTIRQAGTYWYHAHSLTQEQDGLYGALVIYPKDQSIDPTDRDYVVLISDFTEENSRAVLANIKKSPHYYNYHQRTVGDFLQQVRNLGFGPAWSELHEWGQMRMSPTDLADVSGYTFLINGNTPEQNWTGLFNPGERVRLRFINASAMSIYDLRIPGLKMTVVQADGQDVEPVIVDEFRISVAETYDVLLQPQGDQAYSIAAESIDRSGFALGTLATREGMRAAMPEPRPRALLTMADMGHGDHAAHVAPATPDPHAGHQMGSAPSSTPSGWGDASTPVGHRALSYADLRYRGLQTDLRNPERTIEVRLGGSMERFIWTMNGKKFTDADFEPIQLKYNERVRITFINETMMAHPMHLHGMFVQPENGQPMNKLPNKHTVNIAPGQTYSVLLTADEPGEWAFHCHMLYHMSAGMMSKVVVAQFDPHAGHSSEPPAPAAPAVQGGGHDHH